ncbi:MAG: type II toxin-antitoxin system VapC family toxin [Opitutales bacterium]|nr:type II toxin-antitoxin system VapC family toxin [Opitutales bacterium]
MRLLLDTFTFVYLVSDPYKLGGSARTVLDDPSNRFFLSDASVLEICLKYNDGTLEMPETPRSWIKKQCDIWQVRSLAITREHTFRLSELPYHHDDAIDRILVATALSEEMALISEDENIKKYPVTVIW